MGDLEAVVLIIVGVLMFVMVVVLGKAIHTNKVFRNSF